MKHTKLRDSNDDLGAVRGLGVGLFVGLALWGGEHCHRQCRDQVTEVRDAGHILCEPLF